jgi:hypothetical protein
MLGIFEISENFLEIMGNLEKGGKFRKTLEIFKEL